jgi:hypothetical protein
MRLEVRQSSGAWERVAGPNFGSTRGRGGNSVRGLEPICIVKKTTPLRVFTSIYIGLFLAGILAYVIDIVQRIAFGWLYHIYYSYWHDNFSGWVRFAMSYGLLGLPIILIFSHFCAWLVNLFAKDSMDVKHLENTKPNWRRPIIHLCWIVLAFISSYSLMNVFFWQLDLYKQRALRLERLTQQQKVIERVQLAGEWDAIRRGCVSLAEQNANGFYSRWHDTNGLPTAIAALKPMMVEYRPQYGCVRIRIFGMHSTGGHSTPYFGLEVDTSTNSVGYNHGTGYENGGVIGNHHSTYNQVAEGVFEIY